ncbi:MAG: hypothetical protein U1F68_14385 [Gammaproteobacteria bacterium]
MESDSKPDAGQINIASVTDIDSIARKPRTRAKSPVPEPGQKALPPPAAEPIDLDAPQWYLNRELTWLAFQRRVLFEAADERNPLLERVKFVAIVGSNLDEFFMKRIGGLKQQIGAGLKELSMDGRTPAQQLANATPKCAPSNANSANCSARAARLLAEHGAIRRYAELDQGQQAWMRDYYLRNIFPLVTPQAMDPAHPFPFISNLSLNLLVAVRYPDDDQSALVRIKVPNVTGVPRFLRVGDEYLYVRLEEVMAHNLDLLFPGMVVESCSAASATPIPSTTPRNKPMICWR